MKKTLRYAIALLTLACGTVLSLRATDGGMDNPLSFAFVPQQSASRIAEDWTPLLMEISRRSGVPLALRTAPGIPAFEERLGRGEYDLAYMNPYHYVIFHGSAGYRAFAREGDRRLSGILVVRKESPYRQLADLAGKTVAFPAPAAFAASILTQAEFRRREIPVVAKFVSSHDSVYRVVASGLQEAGGGIRRTLDAAPAEVRDALRVIAETPAYSPHAFAAHPRVPERTLERIRDAMLSLAGDETGRGLLKRVEFKGIVAARNEDWDDIRALGIQRPEATADGPR